MAPPPGARLDLESGFSGLCVRTKRVVRCDDSENDPRVDSQACRQLGARSLLAVPLLQHNGVVGMLEGFFSEPFVLTDDDVRNLSLVAEHILDVLKLKAKSATQLRHQR